MTLKKFVDTYIDKKVDFDGAFGAQCVDLFRQYCQDVLHIPHTGAVEGAKDLFLQHEKLQQPKYFRRIPKDENGILIIPGDVVVFDGTSSNKYGHIAIVLWASDKTIVVFEQDGFKQDGAKIGTWNYERVLGVLRAA